MGFSISWIAIRGKDKQHIYTELNLSDSGEADEANEAKISGADLPDGWFILFLNDVSHAFVRPESLERLSRGAELVACRIDEHVMVSGAFAYRDGIFVWSAVHISEQGLGHLETEGDLPSFFHEVQAEKRDALAVAGGEASETDFIFDVPLAVAERICGYRHDRWKFDWGTPHFTKHVSGK